MLEAYSVLTRLPAGLAVTPALASEVLSKRFTGEPMRLSDVERAELPLTLARASVAGGASYDGLVALEAASNGEGLFTLDRRAQDAYHRLGTAFTVIGT
jgi:hypothetical protein